MPNDAKLGLVVGVGLVLVVAVFFFRKETPLVAPAGASSVAPAAAAASPEVPQMPPGIGLKPVRHSASKPVVHHTAGVIWRAHTVQCGDTLVGLAQRYYGDVGKSSTIFEHNLDVLSAPEPLVPGTVLLLPELGAP